MKTISLFSLPLRSSQCNKTRFRRHRITKIFCPASNALPAYFFMDILSLRHLSTLPAVPCNFTALDLDMYASNFTVRQDHANKLPTHLLNSIHADLTLPKVLDIYVFGFPPYLPAPTLLYMMIRIFYACHHALLLI